MPSLTRLSARRTVTVRRGSERAITPTAVASVGARAAPSTHAGPHGRPSACPVAATAAAVRTTRTVPVRTMPRKVARISRREVVMASQYRSSGRNTSSMSSGDRCTPRSAGTKPSATPAASSRIGPATPVRRDRTPQARITAPRTTTQLEPDHRRSAPAGGGREPCVPQRLSSGLSVTPGEEDCMTLLLLVDGRAGRRTASSGASLHPTPPPRPQGVTGVPGNSSTPEGCPDGDRVCGVTARAGTHVRAGERQRPLGAK